MSAYYNDNDPSAAAWLRALIAAGAIPPGDVDERSIDDVRPDELSRYGQCHFFAGVGGWPYALQLAGWPGDRPVWTGSCPCQPISGAGQHKGHADSRHLWPAFFRLIAECRPPTVFGEQVAGKDGREWLSAVRFDLERCGYACGATDLPAAGVGAPQRRQRLYWVADASSARSQGWLPGGTAARRGDIDGHAGRDGTADGLADAAVRGQPHEPGDGRAGLLEQAARDEIAGPEPRRHGTGTGGVADTQHTERRPQRLDRQDGRDGTDGGRTQAHGDAGARGEILGLADAADHRREHAAISGNGKQHTTGSARSTGIGGTGDDRLDDTAGPRHDGPVEGPEGDPRDEARLRLSGAGGRDGGLADAQADKRKRPQHTGGRRAGSGAQELDELAGRDGAGGELVDADGIVQPQVGAGHVAVDGQCQEEGRWPVEPAGTGAGSGAGSGGDRAGGGGERTASDVAGLARADAAHGFWADVDWLYCRDGKWRPVRPGSFPLAHGLPARMGRLRGYGNAIVPQVAAEVIAAFMEERP